MGEKGDTYYPRWWSQGEEVLKHFSKSRHHAKPVHVPLHGNLEKKKTYTNEDSFSPNRNHDFLSLHWFISCQHAAKQRGGGNLSLRPPHTCFPSPIPAARVSTKLSDYKNKGLAILPSVSWDCLGSLDPGISAVSCWTRGGGGGGTVGNNALFHNWGIRNTNEGAWSKKKKKLG